jgi:hypothetical protein
LGLIAVMAGRKQQKCKVVGSSKVAARALCVNYDAGIEGSFVGCCDGIEGFEVARSQGLDVGCLTLSGLRVAEKAGERETSDSGQQLRYQVI